MFYFSIFMTIAANVVYHIAQKSVPTKADPILSTLVMYSVALLVTLILYPIFSGGNNLRESFAELNWAPFAIGVVIVAVEIGFLLVYRSGWNISIASVTANVILTLVLLPVGLIFFGEHLSLKNIFGIGMCIAGVWLINSKS